MLSEADLVAIAKISASPELQRLILIGRTDIALQVLSAATGERIPSDDQVADVLRFVKDPPKMTLRNDFSNDRKPSVIVRLNM